MEDIGSKYINKNIKLGSGSFSEVFLGVNLATCENVAIKKISMLQKKNIINKIDLEIEIMRSVVHANIVRYIDVYKKGDFWNIVMEYCNAGSLEDVIKYNRMLKGPNDQHTIREQTALYFLNQLKNAMDYIRKRGYIHRDIKPMNVLLTSEHGHTPSSSDIYRGNILTVKLADFGLARQHTDNNSLLDTICGSPLYMAPELFIDMKYDTKADLWSYGIIMYEMLFGSHPTPANSLRQLKENIKFKDIDFHLDYRYTDECFDILQKLLIKNRESRIEWDHFIDHPWFRQKQTIDIDGIQIKIVSPSVPKRLGISNMTKVNYSGYRFNIKKPNEYSNLLLSKSPQMMTEGTAKTAIEKLTIESLEDKKSLDNSDTTKYSNLFKQNNIPRSQPIPIKKNNYVLASTRNNNSILASSHDDNSILTFVRNDNYMLTSAHNNNSINTENFFD